MVLKWTSKKENLLKFWQEECRIYTWLHDQNSLYYTRLDKYLSVPALLISAVTSTAIFTNLNLENNQIVLIIIGSFLVVGTFLQSLRDFLNTHDLIHKHLNASKIYLSIANDIEEQLSQDVDEREKSKTFIHKIKIRKNDVIRNSPRILNRVWTKLKKSIERGDMINLNSSKFFYKYIEQVNKTMKNITKYTGDDIVKDNIINNTSNTGNTVNTSNTVNTVNTSDDENDENDKNNVNNIQDISNMNNIIYQQPIKEDFVNKESITLNEKKHKELHNNVLLHNIIKEQEYEYDDYTCNQYELNEHSNMNKNYNKNDSIINIENIKSTGIKSSPSYIVNIKPDLSHKTYKYDSDTNDEEESNEIESLVNEDINRCQIESKLMGKTNRQKQNKRMLLYQFGRKNDI